MSSASKMSLKLITFGIEIIAGPARRAPPAPAGWLAPASVRRTSGPKPKYLVVPDAVTRVAVVLGGDRDGHLFSQPPADTRRQLRHHFNGVNNHLPLGSPALLARPHHD